MDNDNAWYKVPEASQNKYNKDNDTQKAFCLFQRVHSNSPVEAGLTTEGAPMQSE